MTIKTFTQAELLKLSEQEQEAKKQMGDTSNAREIVMKAAQYQADTVAAMWQRVLSRLNKGA